jgi:murein L,D-transpeptidase YafK
MKYLFFLLFSLSAFMAAAQTFKQEQLKYSKVKTAYDDKGETVKKMVAAKGLTLQNMELFIRIFKEEQQLEVWVKKSKTNEAYQKLVTYPVCSSSGVAGPKRQEGDYQVPEGFYHVNIFNPTSSYYLSLGVSYPNASDKILGVKNRLGGAIMIHGNCVTIGCIPITDGLIKELYIL